MLLERGLKIDEKTAQNIVDKAKSLHGQKSAWDSFLKEELENNAKISENINNISDAQFLQGLGVTCVGVIDPNGGVGITQVEFDEVQLHINQLAYLQTEKKDTGTLESLVEKSKDTVQGEELGRDDKEQVDEYAAWYKDVDKRNDAVNTVVGNICTFYKGKPFDKITNEEFDAYFAQYNTSEVTQ